MGTLPSAALSTRGPCGAWTRRETLLMDTRMRTRPDMRWAWLGRRWLAVTATETRLDCTPCLTLLTEMGSGFFSWLATRQDPAATRGGKAGETRRHSRDS